MTENTSINAGKVPSISKNVGLYVLLILLGAFTGLIVFKTVNLGTKWMAVLVAIAGLPILAIAIGSLEKTLLTLLILSLSFRMDINPWYSDKFTNIQPGLPLSLTLILLIVLYAIWFFDLLSRKGKVFSCPQVMIPLVLIVIWSILSFTKAKLPWVSFYHFPPVLEAFFIFFYIANFVKNKSDLRFIISIIAITIVMITLIGVVQYLLGTTFNLEVFGARQEVQQQRYSSVSISRASGLFGHANLFSFFMNGFLPIMLVCAICFQNFRIRLLCMGASILGFLALIMTFARGGWIAFALSLFVITLLFLRKKGREQFPNVWIRLIAIGGISVLLTVPFIPNIIIRFTEHDYGSAHSRIPLAITALKVIEKNPLLGVGIGNYKYSVADYDNDPVRDATGQPNHVHNMYLHTAAEIGLPALFLFLWISVVFAINGWRAINSLDSEISLLAIGIIAGLVGMYAHGMIEPGAIGNIKFVWITFLGGLLMALAYRVSPSLANASQNHKDDTP